ncbi:MAG: hypothetical protein ACFFCV_14710 [Promethearchaeota archaeon]
MILLTGFGPFKGHLVNLTSEIVKDLSLGIQNVQLKKEILPVSWKRSIDLYQNLLIETNSKPDLVVLLGIHDDKKYALEKFGWNFKIGEDIEGKFKFGFIKLCSRPLIKTIINTHEVYSAVKDKSRLIISNYAGSYICNYLYYWALSISKGEYPVIFIHIPAEGNVIESIKLIKVIIMAIIKAHFKKNYKFNGNF